MLDNKEPSWHYDPIVSEHLVGLAYGRIPSEWDALSSNDQGRMLETYWAERTMRAWEHFVNRPK